MNERGMVLISVLWIVLVIAFISFSLASAVRVEVAAAQSSFDSERAFFLAKSAAAVMFQSLQNPEIFNGSPVRRENGSYIFPFDSGEARVRLESSVGLIDINAAPDVMLASMFDSLGLDQGKRNQLVDTILDWRDSDDIPHLNGAEVDDYGQVVLGPGRLPRNQNFQSVDELLLVKGMTAQIYYGHIEYDTAVGSHRKIPGVRDLVTVSSGVAVVSVNDASADVLAALPGMSHESVARIVAQRGQEQFRSLQDLAARQPDLNNSETLKYITTEPGPSTSIVAIATVQPSGTSRTARLSFIRDRKKQIINYFPLFYKDVETIQFGRWQY